MPHLDLAPMPYLDLAPMPDLDLAPMPHLDLAPMPDLDLAPMPARLPPLSCAADAALGRGLCSVAAQNTGLRVYEGGVWPPASCMPAPLSRWGSAGCGPLGSSIDTGSLVGPYTLGTGHSNQRRVSRRGCAAPLGCARASAQGAHTDGRMRASLPEARRKEVQGGSCAAGPAAAPEAHPCCACRRAGTRTSANRGTGASSTLTSAQAPGQRWEREWLPLPLAHAALFVTAHLGLSIAGAPLERVPHGAGVARDRADLDEALACSRVHSLLCRPRARPRVPVLLKLHPGHFQGLGAAAAGRGGMAMLVRVHVCGGTRAPALVTRQGWCCSLQFERERGAAWAPDYMQCTKRAGRAPQATVWCRGPAQAPDHGTQRSSLRGPPSKAARQT